MNKETLRALKASIAHWEENLKASTPETANTSMEGCALCGLFVSDSESRAPQDCEGCPVYNKTKQRYCKNSPYEAAHYIHVKWTEECDDENTAKILHSIWRLCAKEELEFLKSLLPKGKLASKS